MSKKDFAKTKRAELFSLTYYLSAKEKHREALAAFRANKKAHKYDKKEEVAHAHVHGADCHHDDVLEVSEE